MQRVGIFNIPETRKGELEDKLPTLRARIGKIPGRPIDSDISLRYGYGVGVFKVKSERKREFKTTESAKSWAAKMVRGVGKRENKETVVTPAGKEKVSLGRLVSIKPVDILVQE